MAEDPWKQVGYKTTSSTGTAEFADCVQVGYDVKSDPSLLEGRAFVVHNEDGSRASCGLMMTPAEPTEAPVEMPTKSSKSSKSAKKSKASKKAKSPKATPAPSMTPV